MKVTVVPAQVTTIEDTVAGGLSLTQLILLVTPVILTGLIYSIGPPLFRLTVAKVVICAVLSSLLGVLALKIKGQLLLHWVLLLSRYHLRPHIYVFNKNSPALRPQETTLRSQAAASPITPAAQSRATPTLTLTPHEHFTIEASITRPDTQLRFITDKKGKLHVAISQTTD